MALSDDQKAMLRLLAQREQGYEDIAALMGLSVDEVRARVKEALAEIDEGQMTAEGPLEPVEPPPPPPPPEPPAPKAEEAPPAPEEPEAQAPPAKPPSQAPSARRPSPFSGISMPKDRGALIGLAAGAGVVVILIVLLVVGGGGNNKDSTAPTTASNPAGLTAAENEKLTQAVLSPTNGSDASGRALFGRFKNNVLLQVEAQGLDPSPPGQSYTVWLYRSPKLVLRVGVVSVDQSGAVTAQLPIPTQLLGYVAGGAFDQIDISLTSDAAYKAELARAKQQKSLPPYTGESILRGKITGPAIR